MEQETQTSKSYTVREQLQSIQGIQTFDDIKLAYATLTQVLENIGQSEDMTQKLINYQVATFLANALQTKSLTLLQQLQINLTNKLNDAIKNNLGISSYVKDYNFDHIVQTRQNAYHVEIAFTHASIKATSPFMSLSLSCDEAGNFYDIALILNEQQSATSKSDVTNWFAMKDRLMLQRVLMQECELEDHLHELVKCAIDNKLQMQNIKKETEVLNATLLEEFASDMYETIKYVASPTENWQMFAVMPRQDGNPGLEIYRYRISMEKTYNINIDTSVAILDGDGEVETPEAFVRYESIRKHELVSFMLQHHAFMTLDEFEARFDAENMFDWFD